METGIVARDTSLWQGHPDVAYFNGRLYVVYRESKAHRVNHGTKIVLTSSVKGDTFVNAKPLFESSVGRYNCPRLKVVGDKLWALCDFVLASSDEESFTGAENNPANTKIHMRWTKDGQKWSDYIIPNITGIVPDRIFETDDNHFLIATHHFVQRNEVSHSGKKGSLAQDVWITDDLESEKWEQHNIAAHLQFNLCEGSIFQGPDRKLICIMRENSQKGYPAFISQSSDHGRTWSGLKSTLLQGCHRPVAGRLKSGKYLVTYREQISTFKGTWAKNTFAVLLFPEIMFNENKLIILPLDHDQNPNSDGGYTGWVQLDNGVIFIVNYLVKKDPKPYITWYKVKESDF